MNVPLQVTTSLINTSHLPRLLASLGMTPLGGPVPGNHTHHDHTPLPVLLDGKIIGEVGTQQAKDLAVKLRTLKCWGKEKVNQFLHLLKDMFRPHTLPIG